MTEPTRTLTRRRSARAAAAEDAGTAPDEMTERLRAAIGKLSRRLRPTIAGAGLTPSQISVLFTVARRGPIGLSELAAVEGLNATMLSRITAQLASAGLIVRSADPADRRQAFVRATTSGRRMRERIHRERTRALGARLAELDGRDRRAIAEALPALEQLAGRLAQGLAEGRPGGSA
jgi:DNA-binding MarR family transcriptional regulator